MAIVFWRVDGRLIHGQIAIAWSRLLGIDEIIVVNDEVSRDETQTMLLEFATPPGVKLKICSVADAITLINNNEFEGNRTMVVFKYIKDAVRIVEGGINIKSLNIGGAYFSEGKTQYNKALALDENDIEDLRYLSRKGVELFYQVAPMNEKEPLSKYVSL
ncbi:PTS sugar transporter subunit IIB [Thermoanaerobacter thermohydrosulfuricus]|uniref:PTS system mannose/fructose/N-acetylgalactosamine-transporter subunit IIB n=1 Tax=Thermoanaerobacter TaxID=1754 RepID=UPI0005B54812|nr:PTS sugar transporter subunit IIB [Thermoanaerobacter sp. YS13]MDI3310994.1 PTS sugar transporter subunit IIB [Thermoanaerobacterium sp.]